jgi:hypothetical protein
VEAARERLEAGVACDWAEILLLQRADVGGLRVFSILQRHVGAQQYNMLGGAIRVGLMLEYNKRVV